jgi:hypothetical protein
MSDIPDIPEINLRDANCCLCGSWQLQEYSYGSRTVSDPPPVCSPCRAERTGAIHIVVPSAVDPAELARRISPYRGRPEDFAGAIQVALRVWEKALTDIAHSAKALLRLLAGRPDEESVAHALMGGHLVGDLQAARTPDPGTLKLTGLAPELARRIATEVPLAEGPALSQAHLSEILILLAKAQQKGQPTAAPQRSPADGSHGDGA